MKIALKSDFRDYYDHYFVTTSMPHAVVFERHMQNNIPKHQQFRILDQLGLWTPNIGIVQRMVSAGYELDLEVVVYVDAFEHAGEGKLKMPLGRANQIYPNKFCSFFVKPTEPATSKRFLQVGNRAFWLKYSSDDEFGWRSNVGNVKVEVLKEVDPRYSVGMPVFAIDFIEHFNEDLLSADAIDFNTSPGLAPLKDIMTAKEVYEEIHNWYFGVKE